MIAQNILAAFVGLAVGVQAGPCKPSSVTTTTGTASTDVTSITSIATSGEPTTTTTGAELTYSCPGGFPADSTCDVKFNHIGGSVGRIVKEADGEALTSLDSCVQACAENKDCDFFAFWPNTFCELWEGNYERNDNAPVPWSWYELSCFCVPETEATTTATEAATTTTTVVIESCVDNEKNPLPAERVCNRQGTSNQNSNLEWLSTLYGTLDGVDEIETLYVWWSMECFCDLSSATTTETAPATTTTTAPGESCFGNEKNPAPSDKVCNKRGYYLGDFSGGASRFYLDSPAGVTTMEPCRDACNENSQSAPSRSQLLNKRKPFGMTWTASATWMVETTEYTITKATTAFVVQAKTTPAFSSLSFDESADQRRHDFILLCRDR
ncbi:hypothetical protein FNAPI_1871 [Fusarium napiforme]|uniref:Apple domain-containing protein n=1 Tax=Fusarium napiforme TaxID=42672 RepID=A0A8H5K0A0_9HYPO|nr:hypothetical protein FNAPI_1871 [Fusarium napiforme]